MHALRQELLPPSGVEFATSLKLTPSCLVESPTPRQEIASRVLFNLVVARSNLLRIFEVREEAAPLPAALADDIERRARVRKGTEAVEGEVEMEERGEGYVNMGSVKSASASGSAVPTVTRFHWVKEHRLHGIVTGIEAVKIMASNEDKLDRLIVSFKDAKIALLEWSDAVHDLVTISIHTYERAPQMMALDSGLFTALLRVDPMSRCAALLLPKDAIAVLPFFQTQAELDVIEQETQSRDVPYSQSFILDLGSSVSSHIRNVVDFAFLPGFNSPTVAVLYQEDLTWTGRLKEFKDTFRLAIFTLDPAVQTFPVITTATGLPHDCFAVLPSPAGLGAVLILASTAVLYVDQSARRTVLPTSGWAARISDLPPSVPPPADTDLRLEGTRAVFADDATVLLMLPDGRVFSVDVAVEKNVAAKLTLGPPLARTTSPALVRRVDESMIFVGSTVGPSVLLKAARVEEEVDDEEIGGPSPAAVVHAEDDMDMDDDDDIYGVSTKPTDKATTNGSADGVNGTERKRKTRSVVHISLCDHLPGYGPISDMTFSMARNGDRPAPELVAATGSGSLGGFTLFQRDLPVRTKRKLHAIGGTRGLWALPLRQSLKINGQSIEKAINPYRTENDSVIVSTDTNPSPGLSRIASRSTKGGDITITTRIPGTTIGVDTFFQRTAMLHVLTDAIRVLEPNGTERQVIPDVDEKKNARPKIRACSICDPYVLILREDDTIGLFVDTDRGRIRRKDMSPMGDKSSRYLAGCFYTDTTGVFDVRNNTEAAEENGTSEEKNATSTLQSVVNAGSRSQWLCLVRPGGVLEIWTLPKLTLVFSTTLVASLQSVASDSFDAPASSLPGDPPRQPQPLDIEQVLIAPMGESSSKPYLFVFLRSGQLAVYEALLPLVQSDTPPPSSGTRSSWLPVRFVKVLSKVFDIQKPEEGEKEKTTLAELKRFKRQLIPFTTSPATRSTLSGVFFTGDRPSWIIAPDKSGPKVYPSGHTFVHSFTTCSLWESKGDFLLYTDEGPSLLEWIPNLQFDYAIPSRSVSRSRSYSHVAFDPTTSLIIAASTLMAEFASFDEDGNKIWEPDAPNISNPVTECSTLELISPDAWITMDGFEFATNEVVMALACVPLETSSTEGGMKEFVAVGTAINRGEDLAVKGATYIFEVVEVVPDQSMPLRRWYKLKLRTRDDAKGPVTALCGLNGYLVSSMGQKIFIRAFDLDERLVGVAFLDVGVYVTSLKTMKNLLLISDAVKSIWFAAFQEDPYKLAILAKDVHRHCVTRADFFFADGEMSFVAGDEDGVVRLYEFNPSDPMSRNGQYLLCRTEFHGQSEYRSTLSIAHRPKDDQTTKEDVRLPQTKLLCASPDGSLTSLTPVDELVAKRLQLLQGQLTRNIQHIAGLNPKALRIVRNEYTSKPLSKGILDGSLLAAFETLPIARQDEMTRQIGTERSAILKDWTALSGTW